MLETVIICALFGVFIFASFITGLHYGTKIKNNDSIEIPNLNPIRIVKGKIQERKEEEKRELEQEIAEINLANIESYDGTGIGQKEIPRKG